MIQGENTAMLMHAFLPILSILGFGVSVVYLASVFFRFRLDFGDLCLVSVLIGFASLIFPMTLAGIFLEGHLDIIPRLHIVCSAILVLLTSYHYLTHNVHRLEYARLTRPDISGAEYALGILIVIFLLEYLFLGLLFPLRGFDAIDRYLPNALIYYQTDSIPKYNLLTAAPIFKEPGHTLLFTYVLYISGRDTYQLLPFLTLVSLTILAYRFGAVFLGSRRNGLLAAALFLALPLTRELLTVWAYYPDIYIAFFYSAAVYFFLLAFHRKQTGYSIVAGLATGLAILTKTSGWTLLFILLLVAPSGRKGKAFKICLLLPVATLLAMKAITTIYVGIAVVIAIIVFIQAALILKMPLQEGSVTKTVIPLSVGIVTGCWWMVRMWRILPQSFKAFIDLYFVVKGSPQWTYPVEASPKNLPIKEHMHSLNFLGACLILFVSAWFAVGWLLPKIVGFLTVRAEAALALWCLSFLAIWFAYYFLISVRYLSIVILPLVLLTVKGTEWLYQRLLLTKIPRFALEVFLLTAATFQIRHYLLDKQLFEPPARSFTYATNPIAILVIVIAIFLIGIGLLIISSHLDVALWQQRMTLPKQAQQLLMGSILAVLLLLTITAPAIMEINHLRGTSWDSDLFVERHVWEYRPTFQELTQAIIAQNVPNASIIGANVFGLEFFVQQPVIDLLWWGRPIVEPLFTEENVTRGLELLNTLNTQFIIALKETNYLYEQFQAEVASQTYLYHIVNDESYFQRVLTNEEFVLYRLTSFRPFIGIVNLKLQTSDERVSVLGDGQPNFESTARPTLVVTMDLTMKEWARMGIMTHVDYISYGENKTESRQFTIGERAGFFDLQLFDFPIGNCEITGLNLTYTLYDANDNATEALTFCAETKGNPLAVQHKYNWTLYNRTSEWVVQTYGRFLLS